MSQSMSLEDVLHLIIRTAHRNSSSAAAASTDNTDDEEENLVQPVLTAYDVVLSERQISEDKNRSIYKTLLSMSLMPQPTWAERLGALKRVSG